MFIVGEFYKHPSGKRYVCAFVGKYNAVLYHEDGIGTHEDERWVSLHSIDYKRVFKLQNIEAFVCIYRDANGLLSFGNDIHKTSDIAYSYRARLNGFVEVIRITHEG